MDGALAGQLGGQALAGLALAGLALAGLALAGLALAGLGVRQSKKLQKYSFFKGKTTKT